MTDLLHHLDTLNRVLLEAAAEPWILLAVVVCCALDGIFPPVRWPGLPGRWSAAVPP